MFSRESVTEKACTSDRRGDNFPQRYSRRNSTIYTFRKPYVEIIRGLINASMLQNFS